jgi:hypothetical protein
MNDHQDMPARVIRDAMRSSRYEDPMPAPLMSAHVSGMMTDDARRRVRAAAANAGRPTLADNREARDLAYLLRHA